MPKFHVVKNISIQASRDRIIEVLSDFTQWPAWSPWLIMEPDTRLEYHGTTGDVGASYSWSGELVGAGTMTLETKHPDSLEMQLEFLKPWKSSARILFEVEEEYEHCTVRWHMHSALPLFMFFMKTRMVNYISMDYARGLGMLKQYIETGNVLSRLEIDGLCELPPQHYIGLRNEGTIEEIPAIMSEDYEKLYALFANQQHPIDVVPMSIYHSMDVETTHMRFTSAIPVQTPQQVPDPFVCDTLDAVRGFKVTHTGQYEHLGNAWSAAMQAARHDKHKMLGAPVGIERYINDPATTEDADLVTEVILALK